MSKDPAVSWYWNDWAGGTQAMTREEKGAYMELLQAQHSRGSVPLAIIRRILGTDFERLWEVLSEKFQKDENGFYNIRLREEIEKRRAYSKSRANNRKKKEDLQDAENQSKPNNISNSYETDMKTYEKHMGNGIGNGNGIGKEDNSLQVLHSNPRGVQGGIDFCDDYQSQAVLYRDFLQAYGDFGRQQKRGAIEQALIDAMRNLRDIRPDATLEECAYLLVFQAKAAHDADRNGNVTKRLNPETWLQNRVYQTNIESVKMPTKKSSIEAMDEAIRNVLTKHIQEQEAKK